MATLTYTVNAVDHASATFKRIALSTDKLNADLDELGRKTATARVALAGDKEATLAIDKLDFKMAKLAQKVAEGKIGVEGQARAMLEIRRLELAMDKLNTKRAKIHIDTSALSKLSAFQPSAMGAAIALSPALIPLAAEVAAGVGAIGISFGAAAAGAGIFGLMAMNVLSTAQEQLKKLQALNLRLNMATTAAQKKAIQAQIAALKATWANGFLDLIGHYQDFKDKWTHISQVITVPTLNVWLPVLTKGLQFLKPLVKPIADAFTLWGITLNTYFSDPATARHIKDMAGAFGNFAAQNLFQVGQFIADIGKGIFNLGRDLAANGANFSSAGEWLARMGDGFLAWSKSKSARDDVHGFMKFLHDEGPVVKGILSDLGKLLPGVFAGATTVGTLELQVLGDFLHMLAGLPKGWQKGLTEAAGALLLLSKLGVIKVGFKIVGWAAKLLSGGTLSLGGATAAAEIRGAFTTGGAAAAAEIRAAMTGGAAAGGAEGAVGGAAITSRGGGWLGRALGLASVVALPIWLATKVHLPRQVKSVWQSDLAGLADSNRKTGASIRKDWDLVSGSVKSDWHILSTGLSMVTGGLGHVGDAADKTRGSMKSMAPPVSDLTGKAKALQRQGFAPLIPDLHKLHANTPLVRTDFQNLGDAVQRTGDKSRLTRQDRRNLISDLEKSGVNARTARNIVDTYIRKIEQIPPSARTNVTAIAHASGKVVAAARRAGRSAQDILAFSSGRQMGWRVPGYGGGDRYPAMLEGGETVVPKHLTPAVAPLMKAHRVPGFASGGFVGTSRALQREVPWMDRNISSFERAEMLRFMRQEIAAAKRRAAAAASGMGVAPNGPVQQYARRLLTAYGWGNQWNAFNTLEMHEAGWNPNAQNPTSTAYGLGQFLDTTWATVGARKTSNPYLQLNAMMAYIRQRYGSPAAAWAQYYNHPGGVGWYGSGLTGGIFTRPTLIGVGDRGPERVDVTPAGSRRREGPLLVIEHAHFREEADFDLLARRLAFLDQ